MPYNTRTLLSARRTAGSNGAGARSSDNGHTPVAAAARAGVKAARRRRCDAIARAVTTRERDERASAFFTRKAGNQRQQMTLIRTWNEKNDEKL